VSAGPRGPTVALRRRGAVLVAVLLALVLPALTPGRAAAADAERRAGPYELAVDLPATPRTGRAMPVAVRVVLDGRPVTGATVTVQGFPGLGTSASAIRPLPLTPDPAIPGRYRGELTIPIRGGWLLDVQVSGAGGLHRAEVPLLVGAPSAIPHWLGWVIGLSPLLAVGWFAWWNRRLLRREGDGEGLAGGPAP
jgi:hypothetical protein